MIFLLGAMIGAIIASKTRIKKLEDKIVKLEVLDDKATQIWEQIKTIKQFKEGSERGKDEKVFSVFMCNIFSFRNGWDG